MLRRLHRAALAAAVLGTLACPGGRKAPAPERFVPAGAAAVLVLPEAGRAARELALVHGTLSGFPGAGELAGLRGAVAAQLGFDPLDPQALAGVGLDPRRGAAAAALPPARAGEPRRVLVVLPVGDAADVEALLERLARDRLGATERATERHGAAPVVTLRAPGASASALAYAIVERTALLCAGPEGPATVGEAAALAAAASLAEAAAFGLARRALGDEVAALWWTPPGSPLLEGRWPVRDGVAVGLSATATRVRARAAVLLGAREPSFRALAADGDDGGARAAARLDPGAQLVAAFHGDPGALAGKLVPLLAAPDRARLSAGPGGDLLALLAPGAAVALSLAPAAELGRLSAAATRADPLRAVRLEAVLPVRDAAAAEALSARLVAGAGSRGDAPAAAGGVHRVRTPSGELAWRVDAGARRVLAAGGAPGALAALEARLAGGEGWRPPTEAAGAALAGGLGGAVLDPARLAAAVRDLPLEAFGTGPSAFVRRSLADRLVDPAARLAAASLRADLAEGALVLALEVEARPGAAP